MIIFIILLLCNDCNLLGLDTVDGVHTEPIRVSLRCLLKFNANKSNHGLVGSLRFTDILRIPVMNFGDTNSLPFVDWDIKTYPYGNPVIYPNKYNEMGRFFFPTVVCLISQV